jgi:hypothetical protein
MSDPLFALTLFMVLLIGVVLVYVLLQRLQSDLASMGQRSRRTAIALEQMATQSKQIVAETHKLPSKVKATKEFIASEARKSAVKTPPKRRPPGPPNP